MTAALLDGKKLASLRKLALKQQLQARAERGQRPPALAVVLVGSDPASLIYVKNKRKACEEVGISSYAFDLSKDTTESDLLSLIDELNQDTKIDGILIQLPLPKQIREALIIERINPKKDVDGFHPYNLGRLAQRHPLLRPCTPLGIMNLLAYYDLPVKRKHALVLGASNIVGRPMSLELLLAGATVTICHKFTQDLHELIPRADFIIVATGKMEVINTDWLQMHQVLIDVGMHRLKDGSIRGDVNFQEASHKVAWITPVPGGVGPMTIVSLLENTLMAATG